MRTVVVTMIVSAVITLAIANSWPVAMRWLAGGKSQGPTSGLMLPSHLKDRGDQATLRRARRRRLLVSGAAFAFLAWLVVPPSRQVLEGPPLPFHVEASVPVDFWVHDDLWFVPQSTALLDEELVQTHKQAERRPHAGECMTEERRARLQAYGAYAHGSHMTQIMVTSRSDVVVVVKDVNVTVKELDVPEGVFAHYCAGVGDIDPTPTIEVDLSASSSRVKFWRDGSSADPQDSVQDFTLSVDPAGAEVFNLAIAAEKGAYSWSASLELVVDGQHYSVPIQQTEIANRLVGSQEDEQSGVVRWVDVDACERLAPRHPEIQACGNG